jgi:hypothetical protein
MQNAFSYKLHTLLYAHFAFQRLKVSSIAAQAGKQQLHNPAAYTSFAQQNASCICNLWAESLIDSTFGSICNPHERTTWTILKTASSSFRYEKGYGDHEEAEGDKICGMTLVNCLYVPLQFVYRLVRIVAVAPIVYTAVFFESKLFRGGSAGQKLW